MGKSIFFDEITGLPVMKIRDKRLEAKYGINVTMPSAEVQKLKERKNGLAQRSVTDFERQKPYSPLSRKNGKGKHVFFDEMNGPPIKKKRTSEDSSHITATQSSSEILESILQVTDAAVETHVEDSVRKDHTPYYLRRGRSIYFDIDTGLQIEKIPESVKKIPECLEKMPESICLNDAENKSTEHIQEEENIEVETLAAEQPVEQWTCIKKKRRNKRKLWHGKPIENPCYINKLPEETLGKIFSNLLPHDRKNCRLVNTLWYNILCNQHHIHETLLPITLFTDGSHPTIQIGHRLTKLEKLENSGLNYLRLKFQNSYMEFIPSNTWENIGSKIQSLRLSRCHLGGLFFKNVATYCPNLQYFEISLEHKGSIHQLFSEPESLERINIEHTRLNTLKFCIASKGNTQQEDGERAFAALLRIFPKIENYSFSLEQLTGGPAAFKCSFTRASFDNIADELQISLVLSLLFSANCYDWELILNVLSTVRLSSVSLSFSSIKISQKERLTLTDFFSKQKALKTVKIMPYDSGYVYLKPILFEILRSCTNLYELVYCPSKKQDCLQSVTETEWSTWGLLLSRIEKVCICTFKIDHSSLHSFSQNLNKPIELKNIFGKSLGLLIQSYPHLQQLSLLDYVSDEILQAIFQHLTELKILDVCLGVHVTKFGLIGGYTIDRLHNLEQLTLRNLVSRPLDDIVFKRFHFPKLTYLHCFLPQQFLTLYYLGVGMPQLKVVKFSSPKKSPNLTNWLSSFCEKTEKLECITVEIPKDTIQAGGAKIIFEKCPTLKTVRCNKLTYYSQSIADGKAIVKQPKHEVRKHCFFIN